MLRQLRPLFPQLILPPATGTECGSGSHPSRPGRGLYQSARAPQWPGAAMRLTSGCPLLSGGRKAGVHGPQPSAVVAGAFGAPARPVSHRTRAPLPAGPAPPIRRVTGRMPSWPRLHLTRSAGWRACRGGVRRRPLGSIAVVRGVRPIRGEPGPVDQLAVSSMNRASGARRRAPARIGPRPIVQTIGLGLFAASPAARVGRAASAGRETGRCRCTERASSSAADGFGGRYLGVHVGGCGSA